MKINRTAQRTVEILKLTSENASGISLEDICTKLDMPKTSAYDIVTTLVHTGVMQVSKKEKQLYTIGLLSYQIGVAYTNHLDLVTVIEPVLGAFAKVSKKTIFFGVESQYELVYLCKFEPETPIITTATVGSKNPMYCTSLGKAILSAMSEGELKEMMRHFKFNKRTKWTIDSKEALLSDLKTVRKVGYALDNRELEEHMLCIGSPVYGNTGSVIGAISASGLYREDEDYHEFGLEILEKAQEVSRLLGYMKAE